MGQENRFMRSRLRGMSVLVVLEFNVAALKTRIKLIEIDDRDFCAKKGLNKI